MHPDIDDSQKVMGDDGEFHVVDEAVDLSSTPFEGWLALVLFWALGAVVFHQFFTRYVLNDSAAWTEEIARYLLIGTVFVGAAIGVAKNNHIQVDFLYRYLPHGVSKWLSRFVGNYQMTIIDLPMNIVYGICLLGFVAMTARSVWVAWVHWKRGYSVLERPESHMSDR
jgi:TRAP-type transport system small permease protein